MPPETSRSSDSGLLHAGAGSALALVQLSALFPGLLPTLGLLAVLTAVVLVPLVALALVVGVISLPPLGVWLLARRLLPNPTRNRT